MDLSTKNYKSVRIGRISYFNVAPVYFGFDNGLNCNGISWVQGSPAVLNRMMAEKVIDISPVSSAAYALYQDDWMLLPDLSISSFGKVMSVLLVSRTPMFQLDEKKVCISDESASAAALLKLVFAHHRIAPHYTTGEITNPSRLDPKTDGFLIIGDKALKSDWNPYFPYIFDLGEIWKQMTGLPFVFAVWAIRKQFAMDNPEIVSQISALFLQSKIQGIHSLDTICHTVSQSTGLHMDYVRNYYQQLLFDLDPLKKLGLQHFYNSLFDHGLIERPVALSFVQSPPCNVIYVDRFHRIKNDRSFPKDKEIECVETVSAGL